MHLQIVSYWLHRDNDDDDDDGQKNVAILELIYGQPACARPFPPKAFPRGQGHFALYTVTSTASARRSTYVHVHLSVATYIHPLVKFANNHILLLSLHRGLPILTSSNL